MSEYSGKTGTQPFFFNNLRGSVLMIQEAKICIQNYSLFVGRIINKQIVTKEKPYKCVFCCGSVAY